MKKLLTIILIIILQFLIINFANAQNFTPETQVEILKSVTSVLNEYQEYADLTADGNEITEEYKTKLIDLFENEYYQTIFNPLTNKPSYINIVQYIELLTENYPKGVEVKLDMDSLKLQNFKLIGKEKYSVTVGCMQYAVGLNRKNILKRTDIKAYFEISYYYIDSTLSNYQIIGIKSEKTILKEKSSKLMKGFQIGGNFTPSLSQFALNKNLDHYQRISTPSISYSFGLGINYFFTGNIGINTGFNYSVIKNKVTATYNNETNNNLSRTDVDNDSYFLYVNSNITEIMNMTCFVLPIKFIYRFAYADKIAFYISPGININIFNKGTFIVTGTSNQTAYYPDYNLFVDDAELYNFGVRDYNDSYDFTLQKLNFFFDLDIGLSIPFNQNSFFNIGLNLKTNITDLNYSESAYRDDYVNIIGTPNRTALNSIGLKIAYYIKL